MAKKTNPKKITNKIEKIVKKYTILLRYMVLGPSALKRSELKLLVESKLVDSRYFQPTLKDVYIDSHLDRLKDKSRKSVREMAIRHLNNRAGRFIDALGDKRVKDLAAIVENDLMVHNQKMKQVRGELSEGVERNRTSKEIARRLYEKTEDHYKDWDRVVTTELAEAQNIGAMDAIIENNKSKSPQEVYVYKTGPHDSKTCKFCKQFWFLPDGVTPKVYKLSELMANGSNIGKKQADWKPTVGNTHPRERHFLLELPISWGFKNGALSYIKEGHHEYEKQKKKS